MSSANKFDKKEEAEAPTRKMVFYSL